jgi:enoyl-CoA hydratase/carnithine racemase
MALITTGLADDVGTITLDNPAKRNALSDALIQDGRGGPDEFVRPSRSPIRAAGA